MITKRQDETPPRSTLRWLLAAAGVLAVPILVIWWPGCRQYPPVSSRESLQLMKLLYTACNTKDTVKLASVEDGVERAVKTGKMTPVEERAFAKIIAKAKAGNWDEAQQASFKFAQDQVGVGHPDAGGCDHVNTNHGP